MSYPAGAVSDRVPRPLVFVAGLTVFAVAYVGLGLATTPVAAWALLPLYGAFTALTDGVSRAWVVDLAPPGRRGFALGLQQGLCGGATIVAGLWAGLLWGDGGRLPLLVSGGVAAVLAAVLATSPGRFAADHLTSRRHRRPRRRARHRAGTADPL